MSSTYDAFVERLRELADIGHAQGVDGLGPRDLYAAARRSHAGQSDGDLGRSVPRAAHRPGVGLTRSRPQRRRANRRRRPSTSAKSTASRAGRSSSPKELVVELSQTESLGHEAWIEARRKIGLRALPALAGENSRAQKGGRRAGRLRRRDVQTRCSTSTNLMRGPKKSPRSLPSSKSNSCR